MHSHCDSKTRCLACIHLIAWWIQKYDFTFICIFQVLAGIFRSNVQYVGKVDIKTNKLSEYTPVFAGCAAFVALVIIVVVVVVVIRRRKPPANSHGKMIHSWDYSLY